MKFERLEQRDEFLSIDSSGRYGLTKDGILSATENSETAVVVDADVDLAKKLVNVAGIRIIGVWVGLQSVQEFESRLQRQIENGEIAIPEDESKESILRARIKEIVKEIEFGIASGIFEFIVLNEDEERSLKQLQEAAVYCFK